MRKILCLLCVLVLLPVSCFAYRSSDGTPLAFDFDFGFEMDPEAFPEEDYRTALGYSELLNRTRVSGTYILAGDGSNCYDLSLNLSVTDRETATVSFRFWGANNDMYIGSPLLGDETLYMNLNGWLKIGLKVYDYFEIPLQETALLLPYATEFGDRSVRYLWNDRFPAGKEVHLDRQGLLALGQDLRDLLSGDEDLNDWLNAIGIRSGFSTVIAEEAELLENYIADSLPDGLDRTVTAVGEEWSSGDTVISYRTAEEGNESFGLFLPATEEYGLVTEIESRKTRAGAGKDLELTAKIASGTENWLDLTLTGENLPEIFPFAEGFTAELKSSGFMTGDVNWKLTGETAEDHGLSLALYRFDPETGEYRQAVRCSGTAAERTGDPNPIYDHSLVYESVYLTALTEVTLSELTNNVAGSFVRGVLPVLIEIPAVTCQVILDQLTEHGVLKLLSGDLDLSK